MYPSVEVNANNTIQQYIHHRAEVLQNLREFTLSPIAKLPPETLSQIFDHVVNPLRVCPDFQVQLTHRQGLLNLCAVCSYWRRTAWSSPRLWTFLALTARTANGRIPSQCTNYLDITRYFFKNSGILPLSVCISNWEYSSDIQTARELIELVLRDYTSRIGSFSFDSSDWPTDSVWRTVSLNPPTETQFTELEELRLIWKKTQSVHEPKSIFRNSPRLRTVSLSLAVPGSIMVELPWNQLTKIELRNTLPHYSFRILINCPQLVDFAYHQDRRSEVEEMVGLFPIEKEDRVLPRLQNFSWIAASRLGHEVDAIILTRFHFPAIRRFELNVRIPHNLRATLHALCIDSTQLEWLSFGSSAQFSETRLTQNIGCFNQLSVLYLKDIGNESPVRFFYRLTAKIGQDTLLPQLRRLKIEEIGPLGCLSLAIRLAHSRRNGPLGWSTLEDEIDDGALGPYDPSSPYWKNHAQLEHLTLSWFSLNGLAWGKCQHHHALHAMVTKAKKWECSESLLLDW